MKNNPIFSWLGTGVSGALAYLSAMELKDLISWSLSILAAIVTIGFTIWSWYQKAKADGKITKDEVSDLVDKLKDKEDKDGN